MEENIEEIGKKECLAEIMKIEESMMQLKKDTESLSDNFNQDQNEKIKALISKWEELIIETQSLQWEYRELVAYLQTMKEVSMKATFGNGLRYKLVQLLMK